jgi:hypothetical protein
MSISQGTTGDKFDNVGGPTDGATLSTIDAPPADTKVAQVYATQLNSHDPYIYQNYVHMTNLVWTTNDLAGTVLFSTPITPEMTNPIIKYLQGIYNTWRGGFDYKLIIAGTAFHAGRLIMYRLPPNLQPIDVITPSDMTHFPYVILDVKSIEPVAESLQDQTQVMYHYKPYNPQNPNTFGGWFCVAVYLQLNTSSSGVNQINVDIQVKASPDFHMSQIIPPAIIGNTGPSSDFEKVFDYSKVAHYNPYNGRPINNIVVTQQSALQIANTYACGALNMAGNSVIVPGAVIKQRIIPWNRRCHMHRIGNLTFNLLDEEGIPMPQLAWVSNPDTTYQWVGFALNNNQGLQNPFPLNGATFDGTTLTCVADPSTGQNNLPVFFATGIHPKMTHVNEGVHLAPPLAESFVLFSTQTTQIDYYESGTAPSGPYTEDLRCLQTDQTRQAIVAQVLPTISPTQCLLFVLTDVQFGVPILYFKMYYDGYMTTTASTTEVLYDAVKYRLRFDGVIQAAAAIPMTAEMARMARTRESESRSIKALKRVEHLVRKLKISEKGKRPSSATLMESWDSDEDV